MLRRVGRRGDTLIEVTLAIGIFSMIAIAVAAVLSSGTTGAQTALESTLTREEIDTQAEALRFVHTAYAVNKNNTESNKFASLWNKIAERAVDLKDLSSEDQAAILQYTPSSCSEMYNGVETNAFIINPRLLGSLNAGSGDVDMDSIFIPYGGDNDQFQPAATSPRLVYASDSDNLSRIEGLYVVAVKDNDTTRLATDNEENYTFAVDQDASGFYDFYIRSCWYGTDSESPSTVSTVIRLYDPDAIEAIDSGMVMVNYDLNYPGAPTLRSQTGRKVTLPSATRIDYAFGGWCEGTVIDFGNDCSGTLHPANKTLTNNDPDTTKVYNLKAVWKEPRYTITYNFNGGNANGIASTQYCYRSVVTSGNCKTPNASPTRSGYTFEGWCKGTVNGTTGTCTGTARKPGIAVPADFFANNTEKITLVAMWAKNFTVNYNFNGGNANGISTPQACINTGSDCKTQNRNPTRSNYTFLGWCRGVVNGVTGACTGITIGVNANIPANAFDSARNATLVARWAKHYTVNYNPNGGSANGYFISQNCASLDSKCRAQSTVFTRPGYIYLGWCSGSVDGITGSCYGSVISSGAVIPANIFNGNRNVTLTAMWGQVGVYYQSHVQTSGWLGTVTNGATSGTTGQNLRLEAVRIRLYTTNYGGITYRLHLQNDGWTGWASNGSQAGTTGQSKRAEAIQIQLSGLIASQYNVQYRAHVQNIGWMDWVQNGAVAGTTGQSRQMEAFQIRLVKK